MLRLLGVSAKLGTFGDKGKISKFPLPPVKLLFSAGFMTARFVEDPASK
jgi:hypothetical protein